MRVAKVRPLGVRLPMVGDIDGGPGTDDPGRITCAWVTPGRLLMEAFGLPLDQLSGSDWVMGRDARFDIVATVPEGATKEQEREMLLNLLKERFHLTYHREKRDFDAYTLVVAKGGPKLKDAAPADGPLPPTPQLGQRMVPAPQDGDGFPILPAGRPSMQGQSRDGIMRMTFRMSPVGTLLHVVQSSVRPARTEDKTGLTGQYDFHLEFAQSLLPNPDANADPAPDLFTAIEKQLGLKLEKSKTQLDVVVVDHMDKEATGN